MAAGGDDAWMSSEAASVRLGIKAETLYAYVSRGMVQSERVPGTRRSRFLRSDIERLAARRRSGGRAGGLEVIIETELTLLDPSGRLYYRGWDVTAAVDESAPFEQVASWLWTGVRSSEPFTAPEAMTAAGTQVDAALRDQPVLDRMRAVVAAARHADPLRDDRRPEAVAMTGRALIATVVECLPRAGRHPVAVDASLAERLWGRLSPESPSSGSIPVLNAALVLMADHELAASTLAARVAASTWADPYLVVQAALAALGGPLHGGASSRARALIREVDAGTTAAEAIGQRLRDGELVPGFGHRIYRDRDPRAEKLLELLAGDMAVEQQLITTMLDRGLPFPNIDFAIAALAERHDMIDEAQDIIFACARIVGWLAHAAEEYQHRLRFRTRAVYTGTPPT